MKKYLFVVCFFSLAATVLGLIFTVQSVGNYLFPSLSQQELSSSSLYNYYPSLYSDNSTYAAEYKKVREQVEKQLKSSKENQRKKDMITSSSVVVFPLCVFLVHWVGLSNLRRKENNINLINVNVEANEQA